MAPAFSIALLAGLGSTRFAASLGLHKPFSEEVSELDEGTRELQNETLLPPCVVRYPRLMEREYNLTNALISQVYAPGGKLVHIIGDNSTNLPDDIRFKGMKRLNEEAGYGELLAQYCELLEKVPTSNFLDLGATSGYFALPVAACHPHGLSIGVEGVPKTQDRLMAGAVLNRLNNTVVVRNAISGYDEGNIKYGMWITSIDKLYNQEKQDFGTVMLMRMDMGANEGNALSGALRMLYEAPPCYLHFKFDKDHLFSEHTPVEDVMKFLNKMGYGPAEGVAPPLGPELLAYKDLDKCFKRVGKKHNKPEEKQ